MAAKACATTSLGVDVPEVAGACRVVRVAFASFAAAFGELVRCALGCFVFRVFPFVVLSFGRSFGFVLAFDDGLGAVDCSDGGSGGNFILGDVTAKVPLGGDLELTFELLSLLQGHPAGGVAMDLVAVVLHAEEFNIRDGMVASVAGFEVLVEITQVPGEKGAVENVGRCAPIPCVFIPMPCGDALAARVGRQVRIPGFQGEPADPGHVWVGISAGLLAGANFHGLHDQRCCILRGQVARSARTAAARHAL